VGALSVAQVECMLQLGGLVRSLRAEECDRGIGGDDGSGLG